MKPSFLHPLLAIIIVQLYKLPARNSGADPGFFLGGGALVSYSTSTPINYIVFLQNTSCTRKLQVISGGVCTPHNPPRSAPETTNSPTLSGGERVPHLRIGLHNFNKFVTDWSCYPYFMAVTELSFR